MSEMRPWQTQEITGPGVGGSVRRGLAGGHSKKKTSLSRWPLHPGKKNTSTKGLTQRRMAVGPRGHTLPNLPPAYHASPCFLGTA